MKGFTMMNLGIKKRYSLGYYIFNSENLKSNQTTQSAFIMYGLRLLLNEPNQATSNIDFEITKVHSVKELLCLV